MLAIGCNHYDSSEADDLVSAELDAQRLYDALLPESRGAYSVERSVLLLSPTVDDVRGALRRLLLESASIDTFTFYFAGHGSVRAGSFYMWLRDSSQTGLSMSAFALADLFRAINEVKPMQTNIIIDACESGGLINDLGVLLKSGEMGNADTPGITLLATSAQDEDAGEDDSGGAGTSAILDCIEGRELVQDHSSTLDLVEIAKNVSAKLRDRGQSPVVWGLNLFGAPQFCRNPFSDTDRSKSMRILVQEWSGGLTQSAIDHSERLWAAYSAIDTDWNPRSFLEAVEPVFASLSATPVMLARFAERLGAAVLGRAENADDYYRPAEVAATLAVGLLPYIEEPIVAGAARSFASLACASISSANGVLDVALATDANALLSIKGGAFSELFYLPLRVAKVLAWGGLPAQFVHSQTDREESAAIYARLVGRVLSDYEGAIVALSDSQAPSWYISLALMCELGMIEQAEHVAGLIFHSLVKCRCNLVRGDATSEQILDYLVALRSLDFSQVTQAIERPNETLTVLLRVAEKLGLGEVFDADLWSIDGSSFMAYFCENYDGFGARFIEGGTTLTWQVGYDFFRTDELAATWPDVPQPASELQSLLVVFSSLLFPDRIPWHILQ
jgi:hypothetical protein